MADAAVSMLVQPMISMIQQWLTEEISLVKGVEKKLEKVSSKLKTIRAVLIDAEKRSVQDESVKVWLEELKNIAYEMDDVLDEWNTSISKRKLEEAENPSNFPQEKISCSSLFTCLPLKQVGIRREVALKIQEIDMVLSSIIEKEKAFNFVSKNPLLKTSVVDSLNSERITTSIIEESVIYGRDLEKNTLLRKLMSDNCQEVTGSIPVISIVGVGGIGKTTLAKQVYNDDVVVSKFNKKIWVCVSNPFVVEKVAREILVAIGQNNLPSDWSLDMLLTQLKQSISNVRFLLVLDDVWDEKGKKWEKLRSCLKDGAVESRILVTTRDHEVAEVMGTTTSNLHRIGYLSMEASLSLFEQIAFAKNNKEDSLAEIGREIVKKCQGLPLAIKTLASLLRSKNTVQEWEGVLHSQTWRLEKAGVGLFPHLLLSYNEFSPAIKKCFSYCSIYPKDTKIDVDELIMMWMAQGYVVSTGEEYDMEQKGREYFNKLAMCCFFQDFITDEYGSIRYCKMHDIMHDFAQHLVGNDCIVIANEMPKTFSESVRHVAFLSGVEVGSPQLTFCNMEKIRTYFANKSVQQLHVLFNHLKGVRELILSDCDLRELPKEIGNLIHLRYLNLSGNRKLNQLPESLCELHNLQTLNIRSCLGLSKLPQGFGKLINLRRLSILDVDFQEYPKFFEKLTSLRQLDHFVVGRKLGKLEYLKNFKHLGGEIMIDFNDDLEERDILVDAQNAQLKNSKYIQDLNLYFKRAEVGTEAVWDALQPPSGLRNLLVQSGFYGNRYPSWLTRPLNNLKELQILGSTPNCTALPPLGKLPNLEKLWIAGHKSIKRIGHEFLGIQEEEGGGFAIGNSRLRRAPMSSSSSPSLCAFPKLVRLNFLVFEQWEEWKDLTQEEEDELHNNNIQIMPRLRQLFISSCPKLKQLPLRLLRKASSLEFLRISYSRNTEGYQHQINQLLSHIPKIQVDATIHTRNSPTGEKQ